MTCKNLLSSEKKYFGPLSNSPVLLLCSPGQALLPLFLVQKHTPVHGGSGCFYSRLSPLLPQVPQGLESVLLHNLPQGPVTSSRCAAFFATLFPSHAQWSKVLFSDESKFCMSFGNQGARVWRKTGEKEMPKCLKSSVKYPQSVMVWGAMSAAGVGPLCFIKGRVNAASYQEILEHFMLPSAEKLYGDEDFVFQHDLAPAHSAKTTGKWFTDHGITVLNWPANSPDLNPIENLWDIVKRKLRDARPNTLDELKAAIEASWASITPQQCHRLIASMPRRIEAVISAKGFPTKY
uniref:Tc1-like transposase DDE domain-containing protein n=1 Tax=Cyprinus carpio carpio TaxID=630221 RepID=A0A9J7Y8Y0_CYPCA